MKAWPATPNNRLKLAARGALLVTCVLVLGWVTQTPSESAPEELMAGVVKTALMSFPEIFCAFTEQSRPFAYIGFAFQIDSRIRYFKTSTTTCQNLKISRTEHPYVPFHISMFGEQVTLYGGDVPTRVRRENGDVYDIEGSESSTTRSYFLPSVVHTGFEDPKDLGENPHPDLILQECRLLTDATERDLCLWYQAGLQDDAGICGELTKVSRGKCRTWIENIRSGRINGHQADRC
jgi:hypothetical protein